MGQGVTVVVNLGSGVSADDTRVDNLSNALIEADIDASFHVVNPGDNLSEVIQNAVETGAEVMVAAGGDGTVSAVAQAAVKNNKTLGVIPFGTLNHFSKDLGIPVELAGAVQVIKRNKTKTVDIGEVNGRYFVNNSSIGLYPRIVRKREQQQRLGRGKWWAAAWAAWRFFMLSPFSKVRLEFEGKTLRRKTPFVFVGNNEYEMDIYNIGSRSHLEEGSLSVYLLKRSGRTGIFMLVIHTLFGRLGELKDFESFKVCKLSISTRKRLALIALDGEVDVLETPLEYRIHPKQLRVLAPVDDKK